MKIYRIISVTDRKTGEPSKGCGAKYVGQLALFMSLLLVGHGVHVDTQTNNGFITSIVEDIQYSGDTLETVRITTLNTVYVFQEEPADESL